MKNKLTASVLVLIGIATAVSVNAAPKKQKNIKLNDDINYSAVNAVVKVIVDQVLVGEDQVDWAYPKFDVNRSSIEQEKVYYNAEGAMKSVPWSKTDKVTAKAFSSFETDRASPIQGIKMSCGTTVNVDLLTMVRYGGEIALKKAQFTRDDYGPRQRALVERVSKVQSMDELNTVLLDAQKLSIDISKNEIKKQYEELECVRRMECGSPTTDQWGNRSMDYLYAERISSYIQTVKRNLASLESNKFEKNGTTITISNLAPQGFGADDNWNLQWIEPKSGVIILMPNSLNVTADFFAYVAKEDLDTFKSQVTKKVKGLSLRDATEEEKLQIEFREGLIAFKKAINGTFRGE